VVFRTYLRSKIRSSPPRHPRGMSRDTLVQMFAWRPVPGYSFDRRGHDTTGHRQSTGGRRRPSWKGRDMDGSRDGIDAVMPDGAGGRPQTRRRTSLSEKQLAILEVIQRSVATRG